MWQRELLIGRWPGYWSTGKEQQQKKTYWKLLGVPMSAFVSFFLLPFTFFSFLLRLLCTMLFMWELLWKLTLLISGFLMSTVAIGNAGPGHSTLNNDSQLKHHLNPSSVIHIAEQGDSPAGWALRVCVANTLFLSMGRHWGGVQQAAQSQQRTHKHISDNTNFNSIAVYSNLNNDPFFKKNDTNFDNKSTLWHKKAWRAVR